MSRKECPELVISGHYALVRHPIYTGVVVAMIGSAMAQGLSWLLPLTMNGAFYMVSALREEKMLGEAFPQHYPAYKARTRMLMPFLL